jgi:rod shape-determining protein MreD
MLKYFVTVFLILLGFSLFESSILSNIMFLPAVPDFLLICVVYYSFQHGKTAGEVSGFVSGLFLDFLSGCPFGLNCLFRTIIGYLGGFFDKTFSMDGFIVPATICFIATFVKVVSIALVSVFYPSVVNTYHIFSPVFGFELLANSFLAPFVFKFLSFFDGLFPVGEKFE